MAMHVCATENGLDSFALCAEGIVAGALPPPGVYLLWNSFFPPLNKVVPAPPPRRH